MTTTCRSTLTLPLMTLKSIKPLLKSPSSTTVNIPYSPNDPNLTLDGISKFFKSHSLLFTRRLGYSETGPIEFTFFLNIPEPATQSTFDGTLIVDIRPQLPTPPVGTLRCFFYETVPAQFCDWDVSNPTKTRLTIKTPVTDSYYQTEIPITITTEDAVGTYGVKLLPLIQRYKFYFYFFRNGETVEHEVYFEDYVPIPITMDGSWLTTQFYPLQFGEEAYFEAVWTNKYMNLATNYFIEIDFKHQNYAWDFNLGWGSTDEYGRYPVPCIVEGLGAQYSCIMDPGGALYTTSTIQIIGLSAIPLNNVAHIRIPKILFGSPAYPTYTIAYLTFTLYQHTPGENTLKIPIMTMDLAYSPNLVSTVPTVTSYTTLSLTPNKPDVNSVLDYGFTSVANPDCIIYEYPSLFTITTQTVTCGASNLCYVFTDPVRWIVFKTTSSPGTSALTSLTIHTPVYSGSFLYKTRTSLANVIGNKLSSSLYLNPGAMTLTFTAASGNTEINSNSYVLFDLGFTTITQLPVNCSMVVTFTALTVPDGSDFYCQVVSGLTKADAAGVVCEKTSSTVIKIFNLAAVSAGTAISLKIQMRTGTTAAVTAKVDTYYERTKVHVVDSSYTPTSLTLTFAHTNYASLAIMNDHSGEPIRASGNGIITFTLTPSSTLTYGGSLTLSFPTDFGVSATTDVLYCKVNTVRFRCTYSLNPLVVTIPSLTSTYISSGTSVTISLTTDFTVPSKQGIQAPSTPGWYHIIASLYGTYLGSLDQMGKYVYVYPTSIPAFQVTSACASASQYAMYTITFQLKTAINAYTDTTTKGRILIEFPVVGSTYFAADLGTGLSNGAYLGCAISGLTTATSLNCRLIKSPGNNYPTVIEVTGFSAITSVPTSVVTVRIPKVKNPSSTSGEIVFGLKTQHVTVATGTITYLEAAFYSFWVYVVNPGSVSTYASPYPVTFQSGATPGQSGKTLGTYLYSNVALSSGDYYVFEVPLDALLSSTLACPSGVDACYSFPQVGWVVYHLSSGVSALTNTAGTISTVTVPSALNIAGYTIFCYVWKSNYLDHYVTQSISPSSYTTQAGLFATASVAALDSNQLTMGRTYTEILVTFTTASSIPATGTIEIRFPTGVVPHTQCSSATSSGSNLVSTSARIACSIQGSSWIITQFDAIEASKAIIIYGKVDLPNVAGTTSSIEIRSYSNQDSAIATNGNPIDAITSGLTLTIKSQTTLSLDAKPTTLVNNPVIAQLSNNQPFMFDFTLKTATVTNTGSIKITVSAASGGFTTALPTSGLGSASLICYFIIPASGVVTACKVIVAPTGTSDIVYTLTPAETLSAATPYRAVITTAFADAGKDGVQFPSSADQYQVSFVATGSATEADLQFFEVFPSKFTSLTVKNYVISPSDEDVIDISLTTATSISTSQILVVEIPTLFNSTSMVDPAIGQSILDATDKKCEVISSSPTASITRKLFSINYLLNFISIMLSTKGKYLCRHTSINHRLWLLSSLYLTSFCLHH